MSTLETLHQVVDQLPEEAQEQLLLYARQLLGTNDTAVDEQADTEALVAQLMNQRYESYKSKPETAVSAEESRRRLLEKYGWK